MIAPASRIRPLPASAPADHRVERQFAEVVRELKALGLSLRSSYTSKGAPGAACVYGFWVAPGGEERIVAVNYIRGRVVRVRVFREGE